MNRAHPDDERLVAIAAGAMEPNDDAAVLHVQSCATCSAAVEAFSRRLPQGLPLRQGVPPELVERVMLGMGIDTPEAAPVPAAKVHRLPIRRSFGIAAALAAGVVLWLGIQTRYPSDNHELDRDVAVTHVLHVKRPSLRVHLLPDATSGVAATLHRGDRVEVLDKQGEWWKVAATNDTTGWALRSELLVE